MTPSLEGWSTKAKEAPSLHEVRLAALDMKPVFQCLRYFNFTRHSAWLKDLGFLVMLGSNSNAAINIR